MSLVNVPLTNAAVALPADVRRFLDEADRRIAEYQRHSRCPAFVAADYVRVYAALAEIASANMLRGRSFCEWGSGFGVVAGLAAFLGFDACGIEAEGDLVAEGRRLAEDFELPVSFAHGSFFPAGSARIADPDSEDYAWLDTDADSGYEELGLDVDDFDLIYAYPWPDEEHFVARVFAHHCRPKALLLTYHSGDDLRLRRCGRGGRRDT